MARVTVPIEARVEGVSRVSADLDQLVRKVERDADALDNKLAALERGASGKGRIDATADNLYRVRKEIDALGKATRDLPETPPHAAAAMQTAQGVVGRAAAAMGRAEGPEGIGSMHTDRAHPWAMPPGMSFAMTRPFYAAMGFAKRFWPAAIPMAAGVALGYADRKAAPAFELEEGWANLARGMALPTDLRTRMRRTGEQYRFAEPEMLRATRAYGAVPMPRRPGEGVADYERRVSGALGRDTTAMARFSRQTGLPLERVAAMAGESVRRGTVPGGETQRFLDTMAKAVAAGAKEGISQSEMIRAWDRTTRTIQGTVGRVTEARMRDVLNFQLAMGATGNRALMGEQAAQIQTTLASALQHPRGPAAESFLLGSILGPDGRIRPNLLAHLQGDGSKENPGSPYFRGRRLRTFRSMLPTQQRQYLMDVAGNDPYVIGMELKRIEKTSGRSKGAEYNALQKIMGLSPERIADLTAAADKRGVSVGDLFTRSPEMATKLMGRETPQDVAVQQAKSFEEKLLQQTQLKVEKADLYAATARIVGGLSKVERAILHPIAARFTHRQEDHGDRRLPWAKGRDVVSTDRVSRAIEDMPARDSLPPGTALDLSARAPNWTPPQGRAIEHVAPRGALHTGATTKPVTVQEVREAQKAVAVTVPVSVHIHQDARGNLTVQGEAEPTFQSPAPSGATP